MSGERDPLFAPKSPPYYPEQPPPYMAPPPSSTWGYPPNYAAPPPLQPYHGVAPPHQVVAVQEQPVVGQFVVGVKPRNYIKLAIFVMACCSPICGLIALFYAVKVDSAWADGDWEGARRNSCKAIGFSLSGIIISVVAIVVFVVVVNVA